MFEPAYRVMWIPEGKAGTRVTLHQMAILARQDSSQPVIQALAQQYPSPLYIDQFFRQSWRIVPDPHEFEFVRAPKYQSEFYFECGYLEGDCDDASVLASCILTCLNWPHVMTAIRRVGEVEFSHVFTTSYEGGYRVDIDPIVPAYRMPIRDIVETMQVSP